MEINSTRHIWMRRVRLCLCTLIFLVYWQGPVMAQPPVKKYSVKNGKMLIELSKQIADPTLDSFIRQFNLSELGLKQFIKASNTDSLHRAGWVVDVNDEEHFIISKPFGVIDNFTNPADRIRLTEKQASTAARFPSVSNSIQYGQNRFRNKAPFAIDNAQVTFFLKGNLKANKVMLSGSFNDWSLDALTMMRTDSGWIAPVKLAPGKYWYKFVVDGEWIIDEENQLKEADGEGNINSVYYHTNVLFTLPGYTNARRVYIAGSFNNWAERELQLLKTDEGWQLPVYLAQGTHTYRYIVDGNWITDPGNQERLPNEFNDYNSVVRVGKPHLFKLDGFPDAKQVILSGSFNGWREDELSMNKTAAGWELPYVLGPGNYEYKFKVDGKWLLDPANALTTTDGKKKKNSYLIIDPNYVFRIKAFPNAKAVYLAGDFNNWSFTTLAMKKQGDEWVLPIYLSMGKHLYKLYVDGEWQLDPTNKLWEQNEFGTGNSIIWIEK